MSESVRVGLDQTCLRSGGGGGRKQGRMGDKEGGAVKQAEAAAGVYSPPSDCGRAGQSGANIWARSGPTPVVMMSTAAAEQRAFTW